MKVKLIVWSLGQPKSELTILYHIYWRYETDFLNLIRLKVVNFVVALLALPYKKETEQSLNSAVIYL